MIQALGSSLTVIRIGITDLIGIDGLKMDYVGEAITPLNCFDFIYNDHTPEINGVLLREQPLNNQITWFYRKIIHLSILFC
ncbi:hypothetical protein RclHR1_06840005 [Rhizophagus clarus]|uniref:Uncharacterized protein n=1 Tax=Rhizophagus clarus TaxID=94130 RepID=A0A2Z6RVX6_9GLOM|nr:hypothetical protein RclHR1_06840005 [Rhizophagus clarus]